MLFDSNGNSTEEPDHIKGLNDEQVLDYQDHMLKVQDKGLDMLSNALDRTKKIGEAIGNEIDDQAPLIKKLGNEVEDADKVPSFFSFFPFFPKLLKISVFRRLCKDKPKKLKT